MGFKLGRVYVLEFEGVPAMEGAIVKLRSPSIDTLDSLTSMKNAEVWAVMADHVIEWNLEDADGNPIPVTVDGITQNMEPQVPTLILRHWYRAARGVTAPLEPISNDGEQSQEEESTAPSMPMETL